MTTGRSNFFAEALTSVSLGSLTLSGTNESARAAAASLIPAAVLNAFGLNDYHTTGEYWRPVGILAQYTTTTTVTPPVVQLWKNGAVADQGAGNTGGTATLELKTAPDAFFYPFTAYTPTADAAGDKWSVKVTTTATAGVATIIMFYATVPVVGRYIDGVLL